MWSQQLAMVWVAKLGSGRRHGGNPRGRPRRRGKAGAAQPVDRRKEEILNAAGALVSRHVLRDATLAVIAADIGLDLKSLRYDFQRREDLVAAAFLRLIALHRQLAQGAMAEKGIEVRVRSFVASCFDLRASVQRGDRAQFVHFGDIRALTAPHSDEAGPAYIQMFKSICQLFHTDEVRWSHAQLNAYAHMLLSQLLWSVIWADDDYPEDAPRIAVSADSTAKPLRTSVA